MARPIDIVRKAAPKARASYLAAFEAGDALFRQHGITTPLRLAHFLAQVLHETGGLTVERESGAYSAKRLLEVFGKGKHSAAITPAEAKRLAKDGPAIFERVYGLGNPRKARELGNTQPGDGWRYRGGGLLQTTGRENYRRMGEKCGVDFEEHPELVLSAAHALEPALGEWSAGNLNAAADRNDILAITRRINGGTNGLADRKAWLAKLRPLIKSVDLLDRSPVPTVATVPTPVALQAKPGVWSTLWSAVVGPAAAAAAPRPAEARPGLAVGGDPQLYDVQSQLAAKGYAMVGQPDGVTGPNTRSAIRTFRAEHGLPDGDGVDDALLAALATAGARPIARGRAEATARDLRAQGSPQVATLDSMGWLGRALGLGGVIGGIQQSGALDQVQDTLHSIQDAAGTVTAIAGSMIGVVQWCLDHWWLLAIAAGLWLVFRAATGVLQLVVLFRQGVLTRADR